MQKSMDELKPDSLTSLKRGRYQKPAPAIGHPPKKREDDPDRN
jgi:hypothetical protein